MSANNIIYIDRNTNKVYYQCCADNDDLGELIGQGTSLDKAVDIAEKYIKKLGSCGIKYGIQFIRTIVHS